MITEASRATASAETSRSESTEAARATQVTRTAVRASTTTVTSTAVHVSTERVSSKTAEVAYTTPASAGDHTATARQSDDGVPPIIAVCEIPDARTAIANRPGDLIPGV
ncbi:hypothetical protein [Phenylobacterium sp. RIFCSPHIGHO2_01_FULL_69_31]|uniref:hypothetical protein n=1 Tax=Phenylobacterium sp. RIFCSPHIGHO2_01_FULL_69_31 TaxID=1801944 RepID=UPI0025ECAB9B|nr:hypothetical protein [Phenylobacterium sp. RIFCSPHIGHO2_01_FULL_69_31]